MKFVYQEQAYQLSFRRDTEKVNVVRNELSSDKQTRRVVKKTVDSQYPYTTATLLKIVSSGSSDVFGTSKVGCFPRDSYSHELGRLYALRSLTGVLRNLAKKNNGQDKMWVRGLNKAMWKCYTSRNIRDTKPTTSVETTETVH